MHVLSGLLVEEDSMNVSNRRRIANGARRGKQLLQKGIIFAVEALEKRQMLAVTISGDIRVPGEQDSFNFNFTEPKRLYFDSLTNQGELNWSFEGPPGALVSNRPFSQSDSADVSNPIIRAPAGSYELTVDGAGSFTGGYQFRLVDLD